MPNYTYTGPEIEFVMRGVHFPQGDEVEVTDPGFAAKLDNLPYFTSDKPKPVATTVTALRDEEIEGYQRKIAGLEAENANLRKQIADFATVEPEPAPVEPEVEEEITTYTPTSEADPDLRIPHPGEEPIPDDWREWHWKRQMVLAKKFTDMEIKNQEDATTAIELELERRGN